MIDRRGIGGSDVAAILGVSPWARPIDVWLRLTGRGGEVPENPAMEWGRRLEGVVVQKYADSLDDGYDVRHLSESRHDGASDWMRASPDAVVMQGGVEVWGVEIKTASWRVAEHWGESGELGGVPTYYEAQCRWYMAVTGLPRWDVAALIGGSDYRTYTIERDRRVEATMVAKARQFWELYVVDDAPPPPDWSHAYSQYLESVRAARPAGYLDASPDTDQLVERIHAAAADRRSAETLESALKNELKAKIGDAAGVNTAHGRVTWSRCKGRPSWQRVAAELADRHGEDLTALGEEFAGAPYSMLRLPREKKR